MTIQQFDTGLQEQKGVTKLEITTEDTCNNKQKLRSYLRINI